MPTGTARRAEPARHAARIEDHGGGHHRAGERPAAGLVAAGDRADAALERAALAREGRLLGRSLERQRRSIAV